MVRLTALKTGVAISALALLAFSGSAVPTATPAAARVDVSIGLNFGGVGFGYFHSNLSRRGGHWINHPIWGDVWVPPRGFRPYYNGYWTYSDYGLLWVGYDRWSDITEHYGRWVWDPYYHAYLWIPGYVWSPGWVVWRTGGGYFGWLPMPPDYGDYDDGPYFGGRYGWNDYYGYGDWYGLSGDAFYGLWVFVDDNHFYRHDYRNYAFYSSNRVRNVINRTSDSTNYAVQGDRIVNRSITADRLASVTHQRIQPVEARKVLKSDVPMATVAGGRSLARQEGTGEKGPHFHDRNLKPVVGRGGAEGGGANSLIKPEPQRDFRGRAGEKEAAPGGKPQPNAGEERGRDKNGGNEAAPSPQPQPQPNAEDRGRGRNGGGKNEAAPSPQPLPNADEGRDRGRNRGGNNEATSPQPLPQPAPDEGRGQSRNRGNNEASPSPQPQPSGDEGGGRGRGKNEEGKSPGSMPDASQGAQGRERPSAEKPNTEKPNTEKPNTEKKGNEKPTPDEDKRKKRDRDENSPQH